MASSLIASIHFALDHLALLPMHRYNDQVLEAKIALRSMKVLLVCLRKLVDDGAHSILFSRIQDAIATFVEDSPLSSEDVSSFWPFAFVTEINCIEKEIADECFTTMSDRINQSSHLTVDEVVAIADSTLLSTADFLALVRRRGRVLSFMEGEVIDDFELHSKFLKYFLLFATRRTGTLGTLQLQHLLIQVQPIAIDAARVFTKDRLYVYDEDWFKEVESRILTTNRKATDPQICQAYARALKSSQSPQHMDNDALDVWKNFLDTLISLLWNVLRSDARQLDQLKVLYKRLRLSRSILMEQPRRFDEKITDQLGALISDAGMLVCLLHQTGVEMSDLGVSDLIERFDVIQSRVETNPSKPSVLNIVEGITNTDADEKAFKLQRESAAMSSQQPPHSTPEGVGFEDEEVTSVLDQLTRGSNRLRLVTISGMAGLGKTTLALKLYNHPSIMYHFQARAWCPISQVLNRKKVLLELLNQIQLQDYSELNEDDLANKLRKSLKGKRYLVFLDDVWTNEAWSNLAVSFPDDSTQSRIIFTSRRHDIAPSALHVDGGPHSLRLRKDNECLEILQAKLRFEKGWTSEFGMKIAKMCKGLPLTVVIVAGLLATTEEEAWNGILDHLGSRDASITEQCMGTLELSYKHLPDYLQPCFLYFGALPEDQEVSVRKLISLWIAEGFIQVSSLTRKEDVARKLLDELIQRSLVMVAQNKSIGGVKTCRVHDILHDFCLVKAKQESFFHLLRGQDELLNFNEPCSLQRLCIHSDPLHLKKSELFCPRARSLMFFSSITQQSVRYPSYLFDMSLIIQIFKHLEVLDIEQIALSCGLPTEIELLTRLKYLSVVTKVGVIPFSVGNLSNLETFIVSVPVEEVRKAISLPQTLWNLHKLRHLHTSSFQGFSFSVENLENSSDLLELETLSGLVFYLDGSMERLMKKFPNIRRLKCSILSGLDSRESLNKVVVPGFLNQLESLSIRRRGGHFRLELGSTKNLRKLTLRGFKLSREETAAIGKIPSLEVLKLLEISFEEGTLEMEEGEFSNLRVLVLFQNFSSNLERWTVFDELPCLQKLALGLCAKLKEMPACLETLPTLEEIRVIASSPFVESLVAGIEQVQMDYGNSVKIYISKSN